jgi:hypothetical protein
MSIKNLCLIFLMLFSATGYSQVNDDSEYERLACYQYNNYGVNSSYYCNQDYDCQWRNRRCEDRFAPRPVQCQAIRNYNRCVNTQDCTWDQRRGCVRGFDGGLQGVFERIAADQGWEEHRGGHIGRGRTQREAENVALRVCQQNHGNCFVRSCQRIR